MQMFICSCHASCQIVADLEKGIVILLGTCVLTFSACRAEDMGLEYERAVLRHLRLFPIHSPRGHLFGPLPPVTDTVTQLIGTIICI